MNRLLIQGTDETPSIHFDPAGELSIQGVSMPEDPSEFYRPVIGWMKQFVADFRGDSCTMLVNMTYFNSTSAKRIFQLIHALEALHNQGKRIKVIWQYEDDDDLIREKGEEINQLLALELQLKPIHS